MVFIGTIEWIDNLQWTGSIKWKSVDRKALAVKGINEGYKKTLNNFSVYWVNRAGHMVISSLQLNYINNF